MSRRSLSLLVVILVIAAVALVFILVAWFATGGSSPANARLRSHIDGHGHSHVQVRALFQQVLQSLSLPHSQRLRQRPARRRTSSLSR